MQASWNHCLQWWHCSIRRYHLEDQRNRVSSAAALLAGTNRLALEVAMHGAWESAGPGGQRKRLSPELFHRVKDEWGALLYK